MASKKSKGTELSVFKGREARLNRAIFQVLSAEAHQAIWGIFKGVSKLRGLKGKRYAVVEVRVKALETEGYLTKAGERDTKQGKRATLFKMTGRAKLALELNSIDMDDLLEGLDENEALTILKALSNKSPKQSSTPGKP